MDCDIKNKVFEVDWLMENLLVCGRSLAVINFISITKEKEGNF